MPRKGSKIAPPASNARYQRSYRSWVGADSLRGFHRASHYCLLVIALMAMRGALVRTLEWRRFQDPVDGSLTIATSPAAPNVEPSASGANRQELTAKSATNQEYNQ